ncbi:hypothetical protein DYI81_04985 [Acinetobacter sp. SWAC5]|uniref:glycosyltransferase family 39 protein n=1 Tax=Acinetobacter sp. SWAC5 TaxID=2293835 RepID=UPI000E350534|nr:glycosyltransferase family 39 protein [Acinetobacter sp. SWAC5]RFS33274.1 hypothetical protein DYI81_04985 [Acinetobacter sp. SWAC5]
MELKEKKIIYFSMFIMIMLGLYLRYLVVQYSVVDTPLRADAREYYNYAVNIHEWGVYSKDHAISESPKPDSLRSPGFSFFASIFYNSNQDIFIKHVLIAQTIFQVISFTFLFFVLHRFYGVVVSLITGWFLWTFPHFVNINIYFLSESLFTSLLALLIGMAILSNFAEHKRKFYYTFFAILLGLAILVRPTLQYFPVFLFIIYFIYYRKITKFSIFFLIISLLPMLLWGARNLFVIGQWSDPTLMINGLYHGSFPWFMYNDIPESFGFPYNFDPQANEVYQGVGRTLEIIFERFVEDPLNYLSWYLIGKQFFLWQWSIIAGQGDIFIYPTLASPYYGEKISLFTYSINKCVHVFWLIGAFSGLIVLIKRFFKRETLSFAILVISAVFLYAILIHIIVAPFPRYGIPFKIPAMIIFAITFSEIIKWLKRKFV